VAGQNSSQQDVVVNHIFDARRERVFKAWTDPKLVQRWWGPHGFTSPVCELDVRPGGAFRIHMQGPDGTIYPMIGVYREIVEPERLAFSNTPLDDKDNPLFEILTTVTFVERDGKTHVSVHNRILMTTPGAEMYLQGMEEGWSQSLECLEEIVMEKIA
jgi:uncharacterized protein YndB with AHSA1/START domain